MSKNVCWPGLVGDFGLISGSRFRRNFSTINIISGDYVDVNKNGLYANYKLSRLKLWDVYAYFFNYNITIIERYGEAMYDVYYKYMILPNLIKLYYYLSKTLLN